MITLVRGIDRRRPPGERCPSRVILACLLLVVPLVAGCSYFMSDESSDDWGLLDEIDAWARWSAATPESRVIKRLGLFDDQFFWGSGARVDKPPAQLGPFDVQGVRVDGDNSGVQIEYHMRTSPAGTPGATPFFFKSAFDLSRVRSECWWCKRVLAWLPFRTQTASAQGAVNPFGGPNFREDVVIFGRIDGPGRFALRAIVGGRERQIAGSVGLSGRVLRMTLPMPTLIELGLARPGIRLIFGIVGPPPESIYDRVPERGAIQAGLPGRDGIDAAMVKTGFDLNGDGKNDLLYLDTNGNDLIDAVAWDLNGDGRVAFADREGPFLFISTAGVPLELSAVERRSVGRQQLYLAVHASMGMLIVVEDRNGDGDVADPGEFRVFYVPLQ